MSIQTVTDLDEFYKKQDPWDYETNADDKKRKDILIAEMSTLPKLDAVLDIGCGHGFITRDLPGERITGADLSTKAIKQAQKSDTKSHYIAADLFDLNHDLLGEEKGYDAIVITGVLYPQYIGNARTTVYQVIDKLLKPSGFLISVQIEEWTRARFPYVLTKTMTYSYREYEHTIEVYVKV